MSAAKTMARRTSDTDTSFEQRSAHLSAANALMLRLGTQLDLTSLTSELVGAVSEITGLASVVLLIRDEDGAVLRFQASNKGELTTRLRDQLYLSLRPSGATSDESWRQGECTLVMPSALLPTSSLGGAAALIQQPFLLMPLLVSEPRGWYTDVLLGPNPKLSKSE